MTAFQFNDGGRAAAGYKTKRGDCVVRAIAIACELPYAQVRDALNDRAQLLTCAAERGTAREVYEPYLVELGWTWTPTMLIGSGCKVHLLASELPPGRLICRVSVHLVAVIDGVIHDNHNPARNGTRCVYGYYRKEST
jgi:hypothetical protein